MYSVSEYILRSLKKLIDPLLLLEFLPEFFLSDLYQNNTIQPGVFLSVFLFKTKLLIINPLYDIPIVFFRIRGEKLVRTSI